MQRLGDVQNRGPFREHKGILQAAKRKKERDERWEQRGHQKLDPKRACKPCCRVWDFS